MMGPKTLAKIKQELCDALGTSAHDPVAWLQARIEVLERDGKRDRAEIELLMSLCRVLANAETDRPPAKRAPRKTRR